MIGQHFLQESESKMKKKIIAENVENRVHSNQSKKGRQELHLVTINVIHGNQMSRLYAFCYQQMQFFLFFIIYYVMYAIIIITINYSFSVYIIDYRNAGLYGYRLF